MPFSNSINQIKNWIFHESMLIVRPSQPKIRGDLFAINIHTCFSFSKSFLFYATHYVKIV